MTIVCPAVRYAWFLNSPFYLIIVDWDSNTECLLEDWINVVREIFIFKKEFFLLNLVTDKTN